MTDRVALLVVMMLIGTTLLVQSTSSATTSSSKLHVAGELRPQQSMRAGISGDWKSLMMTVAPEDYVLSTFDGNIESMDSIIRMINGGEDLSLVVPNDDFDGTVINADKWSILSENGATVSQNGRIIITSNGNFRNSKVHLYTTYDFPGDFDIQADYAIGGGWANPMQDNSPNAHLDGASLAVWTGQNWIHITRHRSDFYGPPSPPYPALPTANELLVFSPSCPNWGWCSIVEFPNDIFAATSGKYRIVRSGSTLSFYYDIGGGWNSLYTCSYFTSPLRAYISAGSTDTKHAFTTYFDNFTVNSGDIYGGLRLAEHDFGQRVRLDSLSIDADLPTGTSIQVKLYKKDNGDAEWSLVGTYTFDAGTTNIDLPEDTYAAEVKYGISGTDGIRLVGTPNESPILHSLALHINPLPDLQIEAVTPVQVLEGQELVLNKATAVRVVVRKTGEQAVDNVPVKVTCADKDFTRFYVAESTNLDSYYVLQRDDTAHPLNFSASEVTKTIYFFDPDLTPSQGSSYVVEATVDYRDTILESDETNNTRELPAVPVYDTRWSGFWFPNLYSHYFRTDWGSTPLSNFDAYYQASNDYLKGVYPVAEQRFTPGKSTIFTGNTILFRGSDGRLSETELGWWVRTTLPLVRIAHPTADRFLAVVPGDWFTATTTGTLQSSVGVAYPAMRALVIAEARSTAQPNGPSIAAHEIGHSYGLRTRCEEYYNQDADCARKTQQGAPPDRIGNDASPGLWVSKRIPIEVTAAREVYCFMGAYADHEYWVDVDCYSKLLNDHKTGASISAASSTSQAILAVGTFYVNDTVQLDDWYILPEAELSTLIPGPYVFEYQDAGGAVLHEQSFDVSYTLMGYTLTESPFVFTIPYITGTAKITVEHDGSALADKTVSAHAPTVTVLSPNGGEQLSGQTSITWSASDLDEDTLSHTVLYSTDDGATWEPVAGGLADTMVIWSLNELPSGSAYRVKVVATDGFNTTQDSSDSAFTVLSKTYLPLVLKSWGS